MSDPAAIPNAIRTKFKVDSVKRYMSTPKDTSPKVVLATVELSPSPGEPVNGLLNLYGISAAEADQFAVGSTYHLYLVQA